MRGSGGGRAGGRGGGETFALKLKTTTENNSWTLIPSKIVPQKGVAILEELPHTRYTVLSKLFVLENGLQFCRS